MLPQTETVWNDLQRLSEDDQHELLGRMMDRFEPEAEPDAEFDAELSRRAEELRADPRRAFLGNKSARCGDPW